MNNKKVGFSKSFLDKINSVHERATDIFSSMDVRATSLIDLHPASVLNKRIQEKNKTGKKM